MMSLILPILFLNIISSLTLDKSSKINFLNDWSFRDVIKACPFHSLNSLPLYITIALVAIDGTQYWIAFVKPGFHLGPIDNPE